MAVELRPVMSLQGQAAGAEARNLTEFLTFTSGQHIRLTNVRASLGHPDQPRTPNAETAAVLQKIERGQGIVRYNSLGELISDCERSAEAPDS